MRGKVCLVSLCFVSWLKHSFAIVGKSKPVLKLSRECSFGTSNVAKIRPSVQLGNLTIFISFRKVSERKLAQYSPITIIIDIE